jgi:scyllo-inositol 2-dehydrogenase (NADP+)
VSEEQPIRYAVVGLGRAGWNIHVHQLRGRPDAKIVAVADPADERRDEAAAEFGCKTYPNIKPLLKHDDVDVVVVATPSVNHGPDSIAAMKAGKHVVVEKPMAMSMAEADRMIRTSAETGRKLFVHQNQRFSPEFRHLREIVDSGVLGRIFHIRNYSSHFARRNDWQTLAKNGGGLLNNTCPHFLDQLLQLLPGNVVGVFGDLQQIVSSGDVEDHVKAMFRTDTGATADIEVSTSENVAMPLPRWILCGSTGTLTMPPDGKTSTLRWYDPSQVQPLEVIDGPARDRKYGSGDKLPWQERMIDVPDRAATTFYDNVYGVLRRGEGMVVTPESVRDVISAIALIRKGTKFPGKPKKQPSAATQGAAAGG